ncbi:hypothetical protein [Nonomuraea sp. KM90]|uniref:hypothetical protein n=1 Tax=Nonomuraea sp. KM90 TaxID=3457428 RepID=UPI003FCCB822
MSGCWISHRLPVPGREAVCLPGFHEILAHVTSGHGSPSPAAQMPDLCPPPDIAFIPVEGGATFDYIVAWRTDRLRTIAGVSPHHVTPPAGG